MSKLTTLRPGIRTLDTRIGRPAAQAPSSRRITGQRRVDRNRRLAAKSPLCVLCESAGRVSAVEEWDHIVPLWQGGADTETNLQGLCRACHVAKTAEEARAREIHGGAL